jgi:hypothetical protein
VSVRGIYEGENATCVTYELRLKGVFAIIPDLGIKSARKEVGE